MKSVAELKALAGASLLIFLSCSNGVAHASEQSTAVTNVHLHLQQGALFVGVRARLIKSGWKPVRMHAGDKYEYAGTEKRLAARHFLEVDSCSTDRGSVCVLYYAKEGTCLRVDTVGEQVDSMRVTRWDDSCPNEPPKISEAERRPR
jgi:hypothetical protein